MSHTPAPLQIARSWSVLVVVRVSCLSLGQASLPSLFGRLNLSSCLLFLQIDQFPSANLPRRISSVRAIETQDFAPSPRKAILRNSRIGTHLIRACLQNGFCLDWEMIGFETRREEASISTAICDRRATTSQSQSAQIQAKCILKTRPRCRHTTIDKSPLLLKCHMPGGMSGRGAKKIQT